MNLAVGPNECAKRPAAVLAMANRFTKYSPEIEKVVRQMSAKEDSHLKVLKGLYAGIELPAKHNDLPTRVKRFYSFVAQQARAFDITAADITLFSIALKEFENGPGFPEKAGLFLSALINHCKDDEHVVITEHLNVRLRALGFMNTRDITVHGNPGDEAGHFMQSGSITIDGNAENECGVCMLGGSITVNGNAGPGCGSSMKGGAIVVNGDAFISTVVSGFGSGICSGTCNLGSHMEGGSITVNGNAGPGIGSGMKGGCITINGLAVDIGIAMMGGEIRLNGDFHDVKCFYMDHGKIFHKGVLIVNK